jgi:sugar-specific transcriptional regulator TrmB
LSLERVIKALIDLGLSRADAKVYVYLAKKGPSEIVNLTNALKFSKQKLRRSIKNLQNKGIVTGSLKGNALFSALPFEQTIDLLIEIKTEQAQIIQESKEELLSSWRKMTKEQSEKS